MEIPTARGPVSAALIHALVQPPATLAPDLRDKVAALPAGPEAAPDAIDDDDLQVSLLLCYELHYRGLTGVDDRWEWEPSLLDLRGQLERRLEDGLRALVPAPDPVAPADLPRALAGVVEADNAPSLASYLQRHATVEQFREFVMHRSVYHLKEADPHTWAVPRLNGRTKAALVEIQADEYGGGRPGRMHSELFARTMRAVGLDDAYGAYVDAVPAATLAITNAMSLFGLHRRWRGALLGHLAALEMTSSLPNRRYGNALRRLGYGRDATWFYDEHVEADAVHEQVAAHDMCGSFAAQHPDMTADVLFGAACCLALDGRVATHLIAHWDRGESSLRMTQRQAA